MGMLMPADNADKDDAKADTKAEHKTEKVWQQWKDKSMVEALIYVCGILVVVGGLLLGYMGVSGGFTNQRILALWVLYFTLFFSSYRSLSLFSSKSAKSGSSQIG